MKPAAYLFTLGYGIFLGIQAQRHELPRKTIEAARTFMDTEIRRTARVMTDEIHKRHAELEAVKS